MPGPRTPIQHHDAPLARRIRRYAPLKPRARPRRIRPRVPSAPTHQFANAEHHGVSSCDACGASSVVDCRYSTIRGLSPLPATSRTPISARAIAYHGNSDCTGLAACAWRYFCAAQPVVRRSRAALDWDYIEQWARSFAAVPCREGMPALVAALRFPNPA